MVQLLRRPLAVVVLVAPLVSAAAALPAPATPLTLAELSDLALRNTPATRIAWANLRQSEAAQSIAESGYWPNVTASYSGQRSRSINPNGAALAIQNRYGPSLNLAWLLLDFGARSGKVDQAAANALASRLLLDQTLQDQLLQVESAYYLRLGAEALAKAQQQSLAAAEATLDAARTRKSAGFATIAELYQAEAAQAAAVLARQRADGALRIAAGTLAVAAGYAPDTELPLADAEIQDDRSADAPTREALERLLAQARDARPALLAAKASEQAADAAVRSARAGHLPSLNLTGSAGATTVNGNRSEQYSAGLRLDLPIFSGFAVQAAIAQARAAQDAAQASTEQLRRQVELAVWTAWHNLASAHSNRHAAERQLQAATLAAEALRARYRAGVTSILDVLTAESVLANARVAGVQARLDLALASAQLGHAAGGLAPTSSADTPPP